MSKIKKLPRVPHAVDRAALRRAINLPDKLPDDSRGYFPQVMLICRWGNPINRTRPHELGRFDVIVRAADKCSAERQAAGQLHPSRPKTSRHRVFVVCDCGREVPAGRLHQHVCK